MKMDDNLSKIFNTEIVETNEEQSFPLAPMNTTSVEKVEDDFDLARDTLRNLIHKNDAVLNDLVDLARNSESPRAFEVAGQLIKTQAEIAKELLTVHKQKKEVTGEEIKNIGTQNNIVFAGSTADLMKMISAQKSKTIDSE